MLGGLSFPIGIQKEGILSFSNLHKQLAQPGRAPVNFSFHLPVLPVAAFCEFEAQDGINPSLFYLISLIILHHKCISCCFALDLLEVGNMHIVTLFAPFVSWLGLEMDSEAAMYQPWMVLQKLIINAQMSLNHLLWNNFFFNSKLQGNVPRKYLQSFLLHCLWHRRIYALFSSMLGLGWL